MEVLPAPAAGAAVAVEDREGMVTTDSSSGAGGCGRDGCCCRASPPAPPSLMLLLSLLLPLMVMQLLVLLLLLPLLLSPRGRERLNSARRASACKRRKRLWYNVNHKELHIQYNVFVPV
jgi:hypothetical protein